MWGVRAWCGAVQLISSVVTGDWLHVVETCELDNWKQALAIVMTYSSPEEFCGLCGEWLHAEAFVDPTCHVHCCDRTDLAGIPVRRSSFHRSSVSCWDAQRDEVILFAIVSMAVCVSSTKWNSFGLVCVILMQFCNAFHWSSAFVFYVFCAST